METVIKCLEACTGDTADCAGHTCPYWDSDGDISCRTQMELDALALLKEQKHKDKMFHALEDDWKRLKELLKEQEAVKPIHYHRNDGTIFKYECRQCRTKIFKNDLFCRHCGQVVKWE